MKNFKLFIFSAFFLTFSLVASAQTAKESFKVSGECGSCKKKIESAAKKAGATYAAWDVDSKILTVEYLSTSTNTAKISKKIAAAGYDTPGYKATDAAYKKLDGCCQYERMAASEKTSCDSEKCKDAACMKDGKCTKEMSACKDSGCDKKDCCKKS
jgi:periplasmic mercuric ion binding protein